MEHERVLQSSLIVVPLLQDQLLLTSAVDESNGREPRSSNWGMKSEGGMLSMSTPTGRSAV